jgi:phosphatidylglycerol lysyltransferase
VSTNDPPAARARVLALLKRHGWNATSFQVLERGFSYWFDGDDACVAYASTAGAWVVGGAPIAPPGRAAEVAARFCAEARRRGRRACFFATEHRFADAVAMRSMRVGEQPVWDPCAWEATLRSSKSLREQLRRARAKGVAVRRLGPEEVARQDAPVRRAVEALIARWLGTRAMAPMGFLVDVQPFDFPEERRYFVAERDGRVLGFLAAVPVYARNGWFLEDLLRDAAAPNGTAESLVDAAMRSFAADGSTYATLGLAPLAGVTTPWLRAARSLSTLLYDFDGVHAFKARLRPGAWEPIHLTYPGRSGNVALYDVLAAFARGSFARFGLRTLLRGPAVVVRLLAVLLVPWTALLALPVARRWFPSAAVQWAWVLFDVAMVLGLLALAARYRRGLGVTLAACATGDAALTLVQAVAYNVPRVHAAWEAAVVAVGCGAPALAAAVLWGALGERTKLERSRA